MREIGRNNDSPRDALRLSSVTVLEASTMPGPPLEWGDCTVEPDGIAESLGRTVSLRLRGKVMALMGSDCVLVPGRTGTWFEQGS